MQKNKEADSDVERKLVVTSGEEQCESESEVAQLARDLVTPRTPGSSVRGFSKQGYWSGLPLRESGRYKLLDVRQVQGCAYTTQRV